MSARSEANAVRPATLWLRVLALPAAGLVLLLALAPPRPPERLPWPAQPPAGALAGLALCLLVTRRRPRLRGGSRPLAVPAARCWVVVLLAAGEELLWRRVALGELLAGGTAAALAATSVGFALAHRARPGLHLATGVTFGGVYVAGGGLAASIAAHSAYNILAGALGAGGRDRA